jgi:hypothetical protein
MLTSSTTSNYDEVECIGHFWPPVILAIREVILAELDGSLCRFALPIGVLVSR